MTTDRPVLSYEVVSLQPSPKRFAVVTVGEQNLQILTDRGLRPLKWFVIACLWLQVLGLVLAFRLLYPMARIVVPTYPSSVWLPGFGLLLVEYLVLPPFLVWELWHEIRWGWAGRLLTISADGITEAAPGWFSPARRQLVRESITGVHLRIGKPRPTRGVEVVVSCRGRFRFLITGRWRFRVANAGDAETLRKAIGHLGIPLV